MMRRLSPSSLNLLENCPRCFWLMMVKKVFRPSFPMPSIVNRFDGIVKNYFDKYRAIGELPPIIAGQIAGKLPQGMPQTLRHEENNKILLWGRPDDYIELVDGLTEPFDHKTRSGPPVDVHPAYRLQLDVYSYLLRTNSYKTTNKALLAYYYPEDSDLHNGMRIGCTVIEVVTNPAHVKDLLIRACDVLDSPMPDPGENCGYCRWVDQMFCIY